MASNPRVSYSVDKNSMIQTIQSSYFLNKQLSSICTRLGLKPTGVKLELQGRITAAIQGAYSKHDWDRLDRIRHIMNEEANMPNHPRPAALPRTNEAARSEISNSAAPSYSSQGRADAAPSPAPVVTPSTLPRNPSFSAALTFKPSPFHQIVSQVGETKCCDAMLNHKSSVVIVLSSHQLLCLSDKSIRILLFCAGELAMNQDIAFPHQSELKVNGVDIKASLRGLKNKPGSTRPVDITDFLRTHGGSNRIEFTYALTHKKYFINTYASRKIPVADLVSTIKRGKRITKQSVKREITKQADDDEIEATSQNLSLKCPLSCVRLQVPCRAMTCNHLQCFDATYYLQLQEQGPQWICPICNKPAPFDMLAVDEFAKDILDSTPVGIDQVTIEPNGTWHLLNPPAAQAGSGKVDEDSDSNGEGFSISDVNFVGSSRPAGTPNRPTTTLGTPSTGPPREYSSAARAPISAKRPIAEVIDLTNSSDEDDEPIARKRQNTSARNGNLSFARYP